MPLYKCIQPFYDAFVCQNIFNKILNVQQIYQVLYINLFYESTHVTLSSHTLTHIYAYVVKWTANSKKTKTWKSAKKKAKKMQSENATTKYKCKKNAKNMQK